MNYVIYEQSTGRVLSSISCPPSLIEAQLSPGQGFVEGVGSARNSYVVNGVLNHTNLPQPSKWHALTGTGQWEDTRNLEEVKAAVWDAIKAARQKRETGTFTHAGHEFDMDPVRISGAVMDAREAIIAGEEFTQAWVASNDTVVFMTAPEMIAMGRAAKAVVTTLWVTSQYLRGLIDAATTVAEVEAITWPAP